MAHKFTLLKTVSMKSKKGYDVTSLKTFSLDLSKMSKKENIL